MHACLIERIALVKFADVGESCIAVMHACLIERAHGVAYDLRVSAARNR